MSQYSIAIARSLLSLCTAAYKYKKQGQPSPWIDPDDPIKLQDRLLQFKCLQDWEVVWGPAVSSEELNEDNIADRFDVGPLQKLLRKALSAIGSAEDLLDYDFNYTDKGSYCFIAQQRDTRNFALVIRGTVWRNVSNLVEDVMIQPVPFDYRVKQPVNDRIMISLGTSYGLRQLLALKSTNHKLASHVGAELSLLEFLQESTGQSPLKLFVAGHSLGGCLATALAPALLALINNDLLQPDDPQMMIQAYTYAAPTAGNLVFAQYCSRLLGDSIYRFYNDRDLVPCVWGDIYRIPYLFSRDPISAAMLWHMIDVLADDFLPHPQINYSHVGIEVRLKSNPLSQGPLNKNTIKKHITCQHSCFTYLGLLGSGDTHDAPECLPAIQD